MATRIVRKTSTRTVELTREEFEMLTADLVPASPDTLRRIAIDILTKKEPECENREQEAHNNIVECRDYLNKTFMASQIKELFLSEEGFTRIEDDDQPKEVTIRKH
jgi:hypothetical protein